MNKIVAAIIAGFALAGCGGDQSSETPNESVAIVATTESDQAVAVDLASLDNIAEAFVKLALAAGQHDPAFVDAYNGPAEWADEAAAQARSLADLEGPRQCR